MAGKRAMNLKIGHTGAGPGQARGRISKEYPADFLELRIFKLSCSARSLCPAITARAQAGEPPSPMFNEVKALESLREFARLGGCGSAEELETHAFR